MNDITKVGGTLNARESLTSLEIVREINCFREQEKNRSVLKHSDLLKIIRDEFEEEINEGLISSVKYKDAKGEERPMFELTFNQAKQVLIRESKFVRKAIILYIDELEKGLSNKFAIPQTYSEALLLASNQAKQIEEQNKQLEEQKQKVEFFNQVTDSKDAVDMKECAKILNMGIGRNRLFEFLRSRAILDRKNIPYQIFIDKGYFRTVETSYTKSDGTNCINIKTVVYQKGMDYIRKIYNESIPKH